MYNPVVNNWLNKNQGVKTKPIKTHTSNAYRKIDFQTIIKKLTGKGSQGNLTSTIKQIPQACEVILSKYTHTTIRFTIWCYTRLRGPPKSLEDVSSITTDKKKPMRTQKISPGYLREQRREALEGEQRRIRRRKLKGETYLNRAGEARVAGDSTRIK